MKKFLSLPSLAALAIALGMISWGSALNAQSTPSTSSPDATAVAANAINAAASVSGDAAFGAADAEFAEWLAIARHDDAAHADAVFAERIAVADTGHDRS